MEHEKTGDQAKFRQVQALCSLGAQELLDCGHAHRSESPTRLSNLPVSLNLLKVIFFKNRAKYKIDGIFLFPTINLLLKFF